MRINDSINNDILKALGEHRGGMPASDISRLTGVRYDIVNEHIEYLKRHDNIETSAVQAKNPNATDSAWEYFCVKK